jgi:chromosome segregation ATPase
MDKAKQAQRRQPMARDLAEGDELLISKAEPANEFQPPRPTLAGREQQRNAISWLLPRRRETLAARAASAGGLERRVVELEGVLSAAREVLVFQKSEKSLLAVAVEEANKSRQAEVNTLNGRLDAMSQRAVKAEKLLAEAQQTLLARTVEASRAVTKLSEEIEARLVAEKKLEPLQDALKAKESQIRELERAQAELVGRAGTLQRALEARNAALARAETKSSRKLQKTVQMPISRTQREPRRRTLLEGTRKNASTDQTLLKRDLDRDDWLLG